MAMNVSQANRQASQLSSYRTDIARAVSNLDNYKVIIQSNYKSIEVGYILNEIAGIRSQLIRAMNELDAIGSDVRRTAQKIRDQEIARINAAQKAVNNAYNSLNLLKKERTNLNRLYYASQSDEERQYYINKLAKIHPRIDSAQRYYNQCVNELNAAKR